MPLASRVVAESETVFPMIALDVAGETDTVATGAAGALTAIVAVPVLPSLVAVICTVPAATAVTRPDEELTDATLEFALDHATARPVSALPLASRVVAASCTVAPIRRLEVAGETDTVATGAGAGGGGGGAVTVIAAVLVLPSLEAVI